MRQITAAERTVLGGARLKIYSRCEVQNADGVWIDLTTAGGVDWFEGATWQKDRDDQVARGTVRLGRETNAASLAPLMGGSNLNRNALGGYAALVKENRGIRLYTAVVGAGVTPAPADWRRVFNGKIIAVDASSNESTITLEIVDRGGWLQNAFAESEEIYGTEAGRAVELVMQDIIDATPPQGGATVVTPVSPGWLLKNRPLEQMSVMDALTALAQQIGWTIGYEFEATGDNDVLLFSEPDRAKTVPDATFDHDEWFEIPELKTDDVDVRNVWDVEYVNRATGAPATAHYENAASIALYGRRYAKITRSATSAIDTAAEALELATLAATDMGLPEIAHGMRTMYFWPVQIGDLHRYMGDGIHYDNSQTLAVVGYRHELFANGDGESTILTRGKPVAYYKKWLGLGRGEDRVAALPEIAFVNTPVEVYDESGMQIGWTLSGSVTPDTNSLMVELTVGLEIYSVVPLGFQYFPPAGTEYRADTTTVKSFVIELRQLPGDSGTITLTPRAEHSISGGGGEAGPPYSQILQRPPFTTLEVEKVGDPTRRSMTLSTNPVDSQIRYRLSLPPSIVIFTPFYEPVMPASGKITEPSIDLTLGDVVVEYQSISAKGVAEEIKRRVIDLDDNAEWTLNPLTESPANYINVSISLADDDARSWACWARNGASPKNVNGEPLLEYRKKSPANGMNVLGFKFYAAAGAWQIVVRVYDIDGNWTEGSASITVGGVASTVGAFTFLATYLVNHSSLNWHELIWGHNQAVEDAAFTVTIRENGVQKVTGRSAKIDHLDVSLPALEGGWHREVLPAPDPTAYNAEFLTFNYEIDLKTPAAVLVATYKTSISGFYLGNGDPTDPGGGGALPGAPTPIVSVAGVAAYSARAVWTDDLPEANTLISWEAAYSPAWDYYPIDNGEVLLDAGTYEHVIPYLTTGSRVRARIRYSNGLGFGAWSAYSNYITVGGSGGGSVAPTTTPEVPTLSNVATFTARAAWTVASTIYSTRARYESSADGTTGWALLSGYIVVGTGLLQANKACPDGLFIRAQIAFENAGGTGPYSAFSNVVEIII